MDSRILGNVCNTTKEVLVTDIVAPTGEIEKREGGKGGTFVGHSNGGGLALLILTKGLAKAQGLALVAAITNFGWLNVPETTKEQFDDYRRGVYWNWFKMDPWFLIRNLIHLHPEPPLSSDKLVHNAFFSQAFPQEKVRESVDICIRMKVWQGRLV